MPSPEESRLVCLEMRSGNRGYWVEGIFYSRALASPLRVENPDAATIFYIPTFTSCWRSQAVRGRGSMARTDAVALRCLAAGRAESGPPESCRGPFARHGLPRGGFGEPGGSCACGRLHPSGRTFTGPATAGGHLFQAFPQAIPWVDLQSAVGMCACRYMGRRHLWVSAHASCRKHRLCLAVVRSCKCFLCAQKTLAVANITVHSIRRCTCMVIAALFYISKAGLKSLLKAKRVATQPEISEKAECLQA